MAYYFMELNADFFNSFACGSLCDLGAYYSDTDPNLNYVNAYIVC